MRYFILVPDGAADLPLDELSGKTPLEAAKTPGFDMVAEKSIVGNVRTVPLGIAPGSDAANLAVMGYDPRVYLKGRSPLEAASIGVDLKDSDVTYRVNLVTLEGEGPYEDLIIKDHSSGDISTEEADILIKEIQKLFGSEDFKFYTGTSYRHLLVIDHGDVSYDLTPPHDVLTEKTAQHLPRGEGSEVIRDLMMKSYQVLNNHPVNIRREEKGLNKANSLWVWGAGTKPSMPGFYEKYKVKGSVISAVDLIKGIGILTGLKTINVKGATGTLHTNYEGKKDAVIKAFQEGDEFVYLHMEGPDECSHQGDLKGKIKAIELIDERILKPVFEFLKEDKEPFRILILPDHRTPLAITTHSSEPVPFLFYDSEDEKDNREKMRFTESDGTKGIMIEEGHRLADLFFKKTE